MLSMESIATPSTAVSAANERLLRLREQQNIVARTKHPPQKLPPWKSFDDLETESIGDQTLPNHLGWESQAVTAVLQATQQRKTRTAESNTHSQWIADLKNIRPQNLKISAQAPVYPKTVKLHHDLATAMLRQELAASGRIWLLLRLIDQAGRGWVYIKEAREILTSSHSELRVCGWRQLRNLLTKGKKVFWVRDNERIWLNGVARVAYELNVTRLSGTPVQIPVSALTGSIGDTKAHFYASLHSGRRHSNPISRATLEETTNVPPRTQFLYETKTGTQKTRNITIGERYDKEALENRAWRHGRSTFKFIDYKGMQGQARQDYIAWRLPNSYTGCHELASKGRTRKINQQLKDLVHKRAQGNSSEMDCRVFYPDGAKAAQAYNKNTTADTDIYWVNGKAQKRPSILWGVLV